MFFFLGFLVWKTLQKTQHTKNINNSRLKKYLAIALYWTQTTLSHNTEWQDQLAAANIL